MRHKTALRISNSWHGGQWSALYQFSSSGEWLIDNHLRYLQEVQACLEPEYFAAHPAELTQKDKNELTGLLNYFIGRGEHYAIKTEFKKHSVYGYTVPVLTSSPTCVGHITKPVYPV
ncbi:MAG TPA: hypothetical protein VK625_00155 [Flavitalea sp.]|nr:hypothetical protein [Flavitalea sp.]